MEIRDLGDQPTFGEVPEKMHAFVVRQDRFGEPKNAWQWGVINTLEIGPLDVLVYVMATGINYNNVWAALGKPIARSIFSMSEPPLGAALHFLERLKIDRNPLAGIILPRDQRSGSETLR